MSVETQRASVIPHPHEHRSRFAACRALLRSLDVSAEKLTTAMSRSEYAIPAALDKPHTRNAIPAATQSHTSTLDADRAGFLRRTFLEDPAFIEPLSHLERICRPAAMSRIELDLHSA